ncbi:MAG: HTTM domain-containing protein [Candidatus Hydrogenedentes bacterium]|nr:HTTM domain-containing protein [Candidatus Hydrogenedentota bacterium]
MNLERAGQFLNKPVDAATLVCFRMFFGALMASEAFHKYYGNIPKDYAYGKLHFTYPLFEWVTPWPSLGMQVIVIIMGLAAVGIMVGFYYRDCALIYLLTYTYIFLIEQARYNNHYYLIILLAFLLTIVKGDACAAVDNLRRQNPRRGLVPYWNLLILRTQMVIVYFYGGLAKLNADWLHGEPMRHWLHNRIHYPVVGRFFAEEWAVYFFAYGGLLFDLSIGFLLLWKRTRFIALVPFVFFHLMNNWLFSIGVFPVLAVGAVVLFFEPDAPRRWLARVGAVLPEPQPMEQPSGSLRRAPLLIVFLAAYVLVQCLVPLRHFLYEGNVSWNEAGHTFAWHMKLRDKDCRATFTVTDSETGEQWIVGAEEQRIHMTSTQRRRALARPQMILQYAHFLRDNYEALGVHRPIVKADVQVSLNGRPYRPMIDPDADLAQRKYRLFRTPDWVLPLEKGLPIGVYPEKE